MCQEVTNLCLILSDNVLIPKVKTDDQIMKYKVNVAQV